MQKTKRLIRHVAFALMILFVIVGIVTVLPALDQLDGVDDIGISTSAVNPVNINGGTVTSCTYVLDAGHGGSEPGAVNGSRYEKDDNLRMTKRVGELLTASGVAVGYTRVTDTTVSLTDRVNMQKAVNAPYFVSFHRNSHNTSSAHGLEIWRYTGSSTGLALENSVLNPLKALNLFTLRGSNGDQQTSSLAVIANTTCPAILIELGFITNSGDNTALDNNFESIARAIASGLCSHVGKTLNTGSSGSAVTSRSTRFRASKDSYFDQYTSYQITTNWQDIPVLADDNNEYWCVCDGWYRGVFWLASDDTIYVYWDLGDTYNFSQVRMFSALQADPANVHSSLSTGMDVYWSFAGANESYGSEYPCTSFGRYELHTKNGEVHNTGAIYYYTADMTNIRYIRVKLHSQNAKRIYIADFGLTSSPVISDVQVSNVSREGYTVSCTAKDYNGITDVKMPTWTHYNWQDDLHEWPVASRNGNTFTYNVRRSEHNNETGWYVTHIYAYNSLGTSSSVSAGDVDVNSYYIDVNGYINDTYWQSPGDYYYGTFDVSIAGSNVANDERDFYQEHGSGTSYSVYDIKNGAGYKYLGYYVDTSSSSTAPGYDKRNNSGTTISGTLSSSRQIVLYYETTYTLNYDPNGGSAVSAKSAYWSESFALPSATRTGYTFAGWKIGNTTYDAGKSVSKLSSTPGGTVSAVAQWIPVVYSIKYNMNGGEWEYGFTPTTSYTVGDSTIVLPGANKITRTGYDFGGWYTASDLGGSAETSVAAGSTGNKEYFAKWTLKTFTVTFSSDENGTVGTASAAVNYGTKYGDIVLPTADPNEGYHFKEWQLVSGSLGENDTVTENIEIRAIFEKDEAPAFVKGDINNDGEIDTSDSSLILKYDAGFVELSEEQISAGDLNSDGGVDAADANYILRYDAGLISEL